MEIVEPLAVLGTAYSAYYLAEMFHWSGIISLIGCGITQVSERIKQNMSGILSLIGWWITRCKTGLKTEHIGHYQPHRLWDHAGVRQD